ncbi:hypothetical protein AI27_09880 [Sphingomonas sp. BHC-A]|uniref:Uncharacterized protein n=1 Tax=Sphingobium indicum F2 TaxID=1450518 RepID=A0A8E0WQ60_9SPHN|nr:hypothetical protein [Sphingobium indicum]EPR17689.1 hypothetical protein M527_15255 [Sphingobium indicum IP26]KER35296.1 hypothetical protein AL00_17095 [Sphingobium indicum F2]KEZ00199.1 hypothetical protein AI27_09880 [Sphingomonas sp. BHC-A]
MTHAQSGPHGFYLLDLHLDEILGWLVILAVVMLYSVMFALTKPANRRWWTTAAVALMLMTGLIWICHRG